MEINLTSVLDEVIVLHAGVASTLLKEFPNAFGATFMLDAKPAFAFAKADVPSGYAPEYGDEAFESRSKELLSVIAPRMQEIVESVSSLGIKLRDFSFGAARADYKGVDSLKDAVNVTGAISGGVGAVLIRRDMLAANDRVLGITPAEFHVIGIVEDLSALPAIQEACKNGLLAGMDHFIDTKLLLNVPFIDTSPIREWFSHFPAKAGPCEIRSQSPVCRLVSKSEHRPFVLYISGDDFEALDGADQKFVAFDRERGFDLAPHPASAIIPTIGM
jgi:hypothetical protein